jgi:hypothetical protein
MGCRLSACGCHHELIKTLSLYDLAPDGTLADVQIEAFYMTFGIVSH